jgi:hypothetical protein
MPNRRVVRFYQRLSADIRVHLRFTLSWLQYRASEKRDTSLLV